jgi:hypothetical protein
MFLPPVDENAICPINIFCGGIGGICLCCACFLEKFVISASFGAFLRSDDGSMFFGRDRSFACAADFPPRSFCEDGPGQPVEIESETVKSSQIMSNTVSVNVNDREQVFPCSLHKRFVADRVVSLAAKTASAGIPCVAILSITACQVRCDIFGSCAAR